VVEEAVVGKLLLALVGAVVEPVEMLRMDKQEQQLKQTLEPDDRPAADSSRVDKAIARANAQVAMLDVSNLLVARMWIALASLLAPLVVCFSRKLHQSDDDIRQKEDIDHGSN